MSLRLVRQYPALIYIDFNKNRCDILVGFTFSDLIVWVGFFLLVFTTRGCIKPAYVHARLFQVGRDLAL